MTAVPKRRLTEAEYLAIERAAGFKSEFFNGEMFARAGASRTHNVVKDNLIVQIGRQLLDGPCQTMSSDQRVKISPTGSYTYPDIVILCGPGEYDPADPDTLTNPTGLIEVLSPTTEKYDRRVKFQHYQRLPSLREYVMVSQEEPRIERYVRQPDGTWVLTVFDDPAGEFSLGSTPVPVRFPLADVYRGVEFPAEPSR